MTENNDSDSLRAEMLQAQLALLGHKAGLRKWERKHEEAETKGDRQAAGLARYQAQDAAAKIRKAERKLAGLKIRISTAEDAEITTEEVEMNRATLNEQPAPMAEASWEWFAYMGFTAGEERYARGATVPDDVAAHCRRLVDLRVIRQRPRGSRFANSPKARAPVVAQPIEQIDHIEALRNAMRECAVSRRVGMRQALDLVSRDLVARATAQWGETRGRDYPIRRTVDHFADFLLGETSPSPSPQQEARAS